MSIIDHIILFLLLFGVYAFWGKYNANKGSAAFWVAAIVPIVLYVFITGSRYGWGNDYLWYRVQFENIEFIVDQPVFKWLNQSLNYIGFNYVGGFMAYAFIFVVCAFVFLRSYGEQATYMYCFLVPATLFMSTNTIRQGVGMAFIFLVFMFFFKRKWLFMALAAFVAINIHSASIVPLAAIIGVFFVFRKPIHYWLSIPLYIFFAFVFDSSKMAFLSGLLGDVTVDNKFQSYIDNSDSWFGEDAVSDIYVQGTFALIMSSLFFIFLFYLGYRALKVRENRQVLVMYNFVVLGTIMQRAVFLFEILRRITESIMMFYFVPLGYIFYVYFRDCKQPKSHDAILFKKYSPVGMTIILAYLFMYWGRFIFLNPAADFFWYHIDDYIDPSLFFNYFS